MALAINVTDPIVSCVVKSIYSVDKGGSYSINDAHRTLRFLSQTTQKSSKYNINGHLIHLSAGCRKFDGTERTTFEAAFRKAFRDDGGLEVFRL